MKAKIKHLPTEEYCQAWTGVQVDEGHFNGEHLAGLKIGMVPDIPGKMGRGNWKAATFTNERASEAAYDGLLAAFSGKVRRTTGLFSMLASEFPCAQRASVVFETEGGKRRLMVGRFIQGEVEPIGGSVRTRRC